MSYEMPYEQPHASARGGRGRHPRETRPDRSRAEERCFDEYREQGRYLDFECEDGEEFMDPFDYDELERMVAEFREDRHRRGIQAANADWVDEPLDDWLEGLDGRSPVERGTMMALVAGMRETLSIRDALILSLVIDERHCPKSQLMEFAARPHQARTKRTMSRLLTWAFEDEGIVPDMDRCSTGVDLMLEMAIAAPVPYCVQPLAVASYVLWWMGEPKAMEFALQCLLLDEDCSLAAMIFSAADRGVAPAWCQTGRPSMGG